MNVRTDPTIPNTRVSQGHLRFSVYGRTGLFCGILKYVYGGSDGSGYYYVPNHPNDWIYSETALLEVAEAVRKANAALTAGLI